MQLLASYPLAITDSASANSISSEAYLSQYKSPLVSYNLLKSLFLFSGLANSGSCSMSSFVISAHPPRPSRANVARLASDEPDQIGVEFIVILQSFLVHLCADLV